MDLVLLSEVFLLTFTFSGLSTDFLIILLKGSQVLTSFGELTFLHTFTDIPVDEGTLGVHKIELVVDTGQGLSDGSGVGNHAYSTLDTGQITTWDDSWWLVVDTALEAGWTPIDELDSTLGLDGGNSGVDILWHDITSVHHAASHVLTVARIALGQHVGWFEDRVGDFVDGKLFVVGLFGGDDWGVGGQHKVDTWVWHQVGLEFGKIDVQGTIEAEGGSQGGDDLSNQSVQVGVGWAFNVQVAAADIVQGFVI